MQLKNFVNKPLCSKTNMRKALLIGIDHYMGENALDGCVKDIRALRDCLELNEDGTKNFEVELLENPQFKKEGMDAIKKLFSMDGEMAILYFSGHGWVNDTDAELAFPDAVSHNDYYWGIKMSDVLSIVHKSKFRNKIIILDCCHAGTMGNFNLDNTEARIGKGVSILCACKNDERSVIVKGDGSLFTKELCHALKGEAADFMGNITIGNIYAYIDQSFGPSQQRPTFKTNVSEFAPIRRVKPKVDREILKKAMNCFAKEDCLYNLDPSYEYSNTIGSKDSSTEPKEPYAVIENVAIFKMLQQLESIGFVEPVGAEHMYWAAINNQSCQLTPKGRYYWRLIKNGLL